MFTATVIAQTSGTETPTGSVTFYDGTSTLGSSTLDTNGRAKLAVAGLAAGSHVIIANYSGDANYTPSSAALLDQTTTEYKILLALLQ
jgi:large repetitive protein